MSKRPRPIILTILDGWGFRADSAGNAIALARKPNYDELLRKFPNTLIHTSGKYVGLPDGQMGNSEVGHLNIGAGRIVHMDSTKLDLMIQSGEIFQNSVLLNAMARGRTRQLHLIGLLSDGGVHSHIDHLFALLKMAREQKVERVFVHCFMDGRDTPPHTGAEFLDQLQHNLQEFHTGKIASVTGRYYAMDRDNRWERIERAYRGMVHGDAPVRVVDPIAAVRASYDRGTTDEFIEPIVVTKPIAAGESGSGEPVATIRDEDSVIFYNFRADRARQMTRALSEPGFDKFADPSRPKNLLFTGITQYDKTFTWMKFLLTQDKLDHILAQVFADMNFTNLRVAETEKYAHVTYFFNGGVEKPFGGEERILVPSPKVPTYDLKPEMSAAGIADAVTNAIRKGDFDAIIMNFANADMVGHSGNLEATIKAVETVDACLGQIKNALNDAGDTAWLITADHGNAETMIDSRTGGPHTYHTTNPVPFVLVSNDANAHVRPDGSLQDISPTILGALGIEEPIEMTGHDLRAPMEMKMPELPSSAETKLVLCVQFNFTFWRIPPELPAALKRRWPEMRVVHVKSYDALPTELPDTDIFVGFNLLPKQLAVARKLEWIHVTSAGVAQLMRPDVQAAGVVITNARGIHAIPMAEHTLGAMLALARKFQDTVHYQDAKEWAQEPIWQSRPSELHGATLLIVGFGTIGGEIARRARAFGMRIEAVTRSGCGDPTLADKIYPSTQLLQALPRADYIVLAAPDTPETQRMIGARELKAMKPTVFLVNIGRGALVDELALIDALQQRTIAGAALDVMEKEPLPPESPLWKLKNVFISPHISAVSELLWPRQTELLIENLERWFSGRELKNIVDTTRGY